ADKHTLVVCGGGAVGKSAITIRFLQGHFLSYYDPTIQDSYSKEEIIDNQTSFLEIIDSAGQEEFYALNDEFMRNGEGFLIVYSITERRSFEQAQEFYQQILRVKNVDVAPVLLFGNKSDLESERNVSKVEGKNVALTWGIPFMEGSAKSNIGVKEAFHQVVMDVRKSKLELEASRKKTTTTNKKKQCCLLM
ncbi:hypothetical protein AKO1_008257, partial [Acrasis kona]